MICSWKVLWSTVLTWTLIPVFFEKAESTAAVAFFGTGSEAFEPNVTVPAAAAFQMEDEKPLKSAYELAMERLRAKDRDEGVEEPKPLTDAQRRRITELRAESTSKLAELEILHRKDVAASGGDEEKLKDLEEKYRIDRERVESRLESAIARVRRSA